jgi:hypothetical protein
LEEGLEAGPVGAVPRLCKVCGRRILGEKICPDCALKFELRSAARACNRSLLRTIQWSVIATLVVIILLLRLYYWIWS